MIDRIILYVLSYLAPTTSSTQQCVTMILIAWDHAYRIIKLTCYGVQVIWSQSRIFGMKIITNTFGPWEVNDVWVVHTSKCLAYSSRCSTAGNTMSINAFQNLLVTFTVTFSCISFLYFFFSYLNFIAQKLFMIKPWKFNEGMLVYAGLFLQTALC